jgi:hypothetical protein
MKYVIRSDDGLWSLQVWVSFVAAVLVTCFGIDALETTMWIKGYVLMGLMFTLGATFTLAKQVRDNRDRQVDTMGWVIITWTSFGISTFLISLGLFFLPVSWWEKGYLGIGLAWMVTSTFTLAKTVRDNEEAKKQLSAESVVNSSVSAEPELKRNLATTVAA